MILEAKEIQEAQANLLANGDDSGDDETDGTMVKKTDQEGTIKAQADGTFFFTNLLIFVLITSYIIVLQL